METVETGLEYMTNLDVLIHLVDVKQKIVAIRQPKDERDRLRLVYLRVCESIANCELRNRLNREWQ